MTIRNISENSIIFGEISFSIGEVKEVTDEIAKQLMDAFRDSFIVMEEVKVEKSKKVIGKKK